VTTEDGTHECFQNPLRRVFNTMRLLSPVKHVADKPYKKELSSQKSF